MDINYTYYGNHFTIYLYINHYCTCKTNTMLHVNYISIKKIVAQHIDHLLCARCSAKRFVHMTSCHPRRHPKG